MSTVSRWTKVCSSSSYLSEHDVTIAMFCFCWLMRSAVVLVALYFDSSNLFINKQAY